MFFSLQAYKKQDAKAKQARKRAADAEAKEAEEVISLHYFSQCCGSGIRCLFFIPGSWMGKKSRSGSGMNIPDHRSESLETIF
jgi:hypothetical protein